jgi:hypothetical protein
MLAGPAGAAEWLGEAGVDQLIEYTDNVDFSPSVEQESTIYTLSPTFRLDGRSERAQIAFDLALPFERYSESRLNSDNQELTVAGQRTLEKGTAGFTAGLLRNSSHTIDEAGTVTRFSERRVAEDFNGYWLRKIGERHEVTLRGGARKVDNDGDLDCSADFVCRGAPRLNNYNHYLAQVDWTRAFSERMVTVVTVFATRFEGAQPPTLLPGRTFENGEPVPPLETPDSRSDTLALQAGIKRAFNERLRGELMLGVREVDTKTPFWDPNCIIVFGGCFIPLGDPFVTAVESTDQGQIGSAGITYTGERIEFSALARSTISPSSRSFQLESEEVNVDFTYKLRERLQLRLTAEAVNAQNDDQQFDREYFRIRPHARWRFLRAWVLDAGVEFRTQDLQDTRIDPFSNVVLVTSEADATTAFVNIGYRTEQFSVFR